MLITNLLPLLARYSLGFDLVAGAGEMVTLTIIPRKAEGAKANLDPGEATPISMTATAAEIDAELALGIDGALGQIFVARKALGDQLAEQRKAAEDAKAAATAKSKAKPAASKSAASDLPTPSPTATLAPVATEAKSGEPVSLW